MLVDCSPVAKLHPFRPLITLKPRSVLLIKAHKVAAALEHKSLQKETIPKRLFTILFLSPNAIRSGNVLENVLAACHLRSILIEHWSAQFPGLGLNSSWCLNYFL